MASVILVICMTLTLTKLVTSAALPEPTMYQKIIEKCPSLKEDTVYGSQNFFNYCKNWTEIETGKNREPLLCRLYYNTFVNYCTNAKVIDTSVPENSFKTTTLEEVCQKLSESGNKFYLDNCNDICKEALGEVASICILSYHFTHLSETVTPKKPTAEESGRAIEGIYAVENTEQSTSTQRTENKISSTVKQKNNAILIQNTQHATVDKSKIIDEVKKVNGTKDITISLVKNTTKDKLASSNTSSVVSHQVLPVKKGDVSSIEKKASQLPENKPAGDVVSSVVDHGNIPEKKEDTSTVAKKTLESPEKITADEANNDNLDQRQDQNEQPPNKAEMDSPGGNANSNLIDGETESKKFDEPDDSEDVPDNVNVEDGKASEFFKPKLDESVNSESELDGDSYFFSYFMLLCFIFIVGYVGYHNKQKILALILEGRRGKRQYRNRRPNSASYHKLDSNLEEAILSSCTKDASNVIY